MTLTWQPAVVGPRRPLQVSDGGAPRRAIADARALAALDRTVRRQAPAELTTGAPVVDAGDDSHGDSGCPWTAPALDAVRTLVG